MTAAASTPSPRTLLTTCSGRSIDLLAPRPEDIDWGDVAEHLAKENRYNGATRGVAYSVAEHLVRGADAILEATGDTVAAAYFVLHDGHEYALKDDTTPKKRALDAVAADRFGVLAGAIRDAFDDLTGRWDAAIHAAAGLPWPPPEPIAAIVHHYDRVMLATEWRDHMRVPPPYDFGADPLPSTLGAPWPWQRARDVLLQHFRLWLPAFNAAHPSPLDGEEGPPQAVGGVAP